MQVILFKNLTCTGFFSRMTCCDDWGEMKSSSADFNWSMPTLLGSCLYWSPSCFFFSTMFFSRVNYLNRFGNRKIVCVSSLTRIKDNSWCLPASGWELMPGKPIAWFSLQRRAVGTWSAFQFTIFWVDLGCMLSQGPVSADTWHVQSFTGTRRCRKGSVSTCIRICKSRAYIQPVLFLL